MMAKRKSKALLLVLILAASALIGWKLGERSLSSQLPTDEHPLSSRTHKSSGDSLTLPNKAQSKRDHLRSTIEMALSLPSSEIGHWLTEGKFRSSNGHAITLFQHILLERWSHSDPAAFLDWVGKNGGKSFTTQLSVLFKNHPEVLSEALAKNQDHQVRSRLLTLATTADPSLAAQALAKILPLPNSLSHSLQKSLVTLFEARPEELSALAAKFPGGSDNPLVVASYIHKLTSDFNAGLDELFTRADGYEILFPRNNSSIRVQSDQFLSRLADLPDEWLSKLAKDPTRLSGSIKSHSAALKMDWESFGFTPSDSQKMRLSMLGELAKSNPKAAFEHLDDYGFSEREKANFLQVGRFRGQSLDELSQLAQSLKSETDRTHFLQEIETRKDSKVLAPSDLLDPSNTDNGVYFGGLFESWKAEDKDQFTNIFKTLETDDKTRLATLMVDSHDLPLPLEGEAIEQLLSHPEGHDLSGWGRDGYKNATFTASSYSLKLLSIDSERATAWVDSLPDNPARIQIKQNLALNWRNLDSEEVQTWTSTQSAAERKAINEFLSSR